MVVLVAAWRMTRIARRSGYKGEIDTDVNLERPHAIEIAFLAIATLYSLTLPLKRTLTLVDAAILISIFVVFVVRIARVTLGGTPSRRTGKAHRHASAAAPPDRRRHPARVRRRRDLRLCRAVRRVARPPRRAGGHQHVPAGAVGRAAGVRGTGAHHRRDVRVAAPDQRRLRHVAVVEGQPVDAARGLASDRVRGLGRASHRSAPRLTPARGAVPHRGAVGVRDRSAREPEHQREGSVRAARPLPRAVRARRRSCPATSRSSSESPSASSTSCWRPGCCTSSGASCVRSPTTVCSFPSTTLFREDPGNPDPAEQLA